MTLVKLLVIICFIVFSTGCRGADSSDGAKAPSNSYTSSLSSKIEIPLHGAYAGAYIDFGFSEDEVSLEGLEKFDRMVGKKQAIIALSSDWGKQNFPLSSVELVSRYGAVPLVFWLPWDRPEVDGFKQNRFFFNEILSGQWDGYIDSWAAGLSKYGKAIFISFALEPNGNWFPWSGVFYGGGNTGEAEGTFQGPEKFKAVYRYVVSRVKRTAPNATWVFHVNNTSDPEQSWNDMGNYYPGSGWVDWVAMSAYGKQYLKQGWVTLDMAIVKPYQKLSSIDPEKPLMLAEWGIGEFPKEGSKAGWIEEYFRRIPVECPRIKAAVFWHERWQNGDLSYSNLRVNSSPAALSAFKAGILGDYWVDSVRRQIE